MEIIQKITLRLLHLTIVANSAILQINKNQSRHCYQISGISMDQSSSQRLMKTACNGK